MVDYLRQEQMFEGKIPEDILMQILKRLPVKCVSRFRCVCKGWRDLIRSRFFVDMHFNYKRGDEEEEEDYIMVASRRFQDKVPFNDDCDDNDVVLSFYTRRLRPMKSPAHFPLVFRHHNLDICTCNSIVCLVAELHESSEGAIYLCKPATRECRRIPPRPFGLDPDKFPMSKVNRVERVSCGFGADPRTNEYKVVSMMKYWHEPDNGPEADAYERHLFEYHFDSNKMSKHLSYHISFYGIYQIEIYDLSSNSWREVEMVLPPDIPNLAIKGTEESYVFSAPYWNYGIAVLLNGCLHWIYCNNILGFDLSNEAFRNVGKVSNETSKLMVVDDSLAIVGDCSNWVSVYVMEEYGVEESWVKRYSFKKLVSSLCMLTAIPNHGILFHKYYGYGRDNPGGFSKALVSCNLSGYDYHASPLPHNYRPRSTLKVKAVVVSGQANLVPLS